MVVEPATGYQQAIRREGNVVDLLLVAQHTGQRFLALVDRIPQEHGEVVTRADDLLDNLPAATLRGSGLLESLLGLGALPLLRLGDVARVVKVPGAQDKVGRQRKVVDPVGVALELVDEGAPDGVKYPHALVVAARVDEARPLASGAPSHAGGATLVARQHMLGAPRVDNPDANGAILACACEARCAVAPEVIGFPGKLQDRLGVALERVAHLLARLGVPYPHAAVHAACREAGAIGAPTNAEDPAGVALECMFWGARLTVPYAGGIVPTAGCEQRTGSRGELCAENGLAVAGDLGGEAGDRLDLENGLRFGGEGDGRLEGVGDAMGAQQTEQVGRVGVDDDGRVGDVHAEAVGQEVLAVALQQGVEQQRHILLGGVGQRYLDHVGHLVAVAVDEAGLEGAIVRRQDGRDVGLRRGSLELLAALAF